MALGENELVSIRPTALGEFGEEALKMFFLLGFSFHITILEKVQSREECLYYIVRAAKETWSHSELLNHLRADDYHHIGALPNNFAKTLSPMSLATKAAQSFRDEYLLEFNKPMVQLTVQGYSQPIGIATYQALRNIPQPYKALAPVIDGVRKVMAEYKGGK